MRIFKKSLAICLAVVLAVSAMVGCFVSAAELSGTVTASNVEIQSDATSVVVPVEIATTDVAEGTEDAMAIVRLKVTSEIGKLTNVALAEGCSNLVQDVTLLKPEEYVNFEDGIILIEAQSYQKGFTSAKINLTFDVSKKTDDKTTYAVDVLGITDIEGANYNEVGYIFTYNDAVITIAPAVHVHTEGKPVVENNVDATCTTDGSYDTVIYCTECNAEISRTPATVPATGHSFENGVCGVCGAADPDYVVAEPKDFVPPVTVVYSADTQSVKFNVKYEAADGKALYDYVTEILDGTVTAAGWKYCADGSDPRQLETAVGTNNWQIISDRKWAVLDRAMTADRWAGMETASKTMDLNSGFGFAKMSLMQMATTEVKIVTYYIYKDAQGESQIVYGDVQAYVLMNHLKTQSDAKSTAIVEAYALNQSVASTESSYKVIAADYFPQITAKYNLKDISVNYTVSYTNSGGQALYNYVTQTLGGTAVTSAGWKYCADGSDPRQLPTADGVNNSWDRITESYWGVLDRDMTADRWAGMATASKTMDLSGIGFAGMNFEQFASQIKIVPYFVYTDAQGESQIVYGDVTSISFNDTIADDNSDLATAYKDLYSMFVG